MSQYLPATVTLNSLVTRSWFLHSTVVLLLANSLDAFTCRVDVKFGFIPLPEMLVRVAIMKGLEVDLGAVEPAG